MKNPTFFESNSGDNNSPFNHNKRRITKEEPKTPVQTKRARVCPGAPYCPRHQTFLTNPNSTAARRLDLGTSTLPTDGNNRDLFSPPFINPINNPNDDFNGHNGNHCFEA